MSKFLQQKYKDKYRVLVPIDKNTNDFPRDINGVLEDTEDMYIKCEKDCKIFYYGKSVLEFYCPSLGRGRNILKTIATGLGIDITKYFYTETNEEDKEIKIYNWDGLYKTILQNGKILSLLETDEEVIFRFKNNDMEFFEPFLKPSTFGASISPYSTKNLPKGKYTIPQEDLQLYEQIVDKIPQENKLVIGRITTSFITNIMQSNKRYRQNDIKKDMKLKCLKGKNYIHSEGFWNEFINYLPTEIKKVME